MTPATPQPLRRQFFLTPQSTAPFEGWKTVNGRRHHVHHHPDLAVSQHRTRSVVITLIGYAIDSKDPLAIDYQIIAGLAEKASQVENVLEAATSLGGRWAILIEQEDFEILFHDPCGLRQVFYSDSSHSVAFCASQASTAAKICELEVAPDAKEFLESSFAKTNPEYWWPGDATQFRGVWCLLPNHYLDLRTRRAVRYAPRRGSLKEMSVDDSVDVAAPILVNLIRGAAERYRLALPITAGWDSRVLLAACRRAGVIPYCYTFKMAQFNEAHQDIAIPARLLRGMEMPHHVIDCSLAAPKDFSKLYKSNTDPAHDEACAIAWGLLRAYPVDFVSLSGHCSEIARCYYHSTPMTGPITGATLVAITQMDPTPFVLKQFNAWIESAKDMAEKAGIDLLDLFYWEQRVGRWAANGQAQWDLVYERFTAFNCRPLLFTLLSTEAKQRRPKYPLYRQLVHRLAPDILRQPINPDSDPPFWKRVLRRIKRRETVLAK